MEQTKRCPYCGEKILATAKKCKHCGEWLVENSNVQRPQQTITKESEFNSESLYESDWMNKLFGATLLGSFLQALRQSGVAQNIVVSYNNNNSLTETILHMIKRLSEIPEIIGDILCDGGYICFIVLLMKVFSNLHKPLKELFLAYITFIVLLFFFSLFIVDPSSEVFFLFICAYIIISLLLPIMIISNYEGNIKTLGWVMIAYGIISIIVALIANYIVSFVAFLLLFLTDLFYYFYLKTTLTKS